MAVLAETSMLPVQPLRRYVVGVAVVLVTGLVQPLLAVRGCVVS
jgi:hypothetical protein